MNTEEGTEVNLIDEYKIPTNFYFSDFKNIWQEVILFDALHPKLKKLDRGTY